MVDDTTALSAVYTMFFLIVDAWDMVSLSNRTGDTLYQYYFLLDRELSSSDGRVILISGGGSNAIMPA